MEIWFVKLFIIAIERKKNFSYSYTLIVVVVMVHRHRHVMDQDVMDHHLDLHLLVEHLNDRRRRHYRRRVHHDRVDNIMTRNLILTTYWTKLWTYRFVSSMYPKTKISSFIFVFFRIINQTNCLVPFSVFVCYTYVYICTSDKSETNLKHIE